MSAPFEIDRVWILLLLPFALALYFWVGSLARRRAALPYPPLQTKKTGKGASLPAAAVAATEALIIALVFLSLSGPHRSFEIVSVDEEGIDVMLAVDISASMQAKDFPPTRLEATKAILGDFIRRSGGNRVGMVVFAKKIFTLAPLTSDRNLLLNLVGGLNLNTIDHYQSGGTSIGDALLYAADVLRASRVEKRAQVIVLLTDGESNDGVDVSLGARFAKAHGIRVHTVGLGSSEPVLVVPDPAQPEWNFETRLTEDTLLTIADLTGGRYHAAKNRDVLAEIFDDLSRMERTPIKVGHFRQKKYLRQPLHLAAAFLFAAAVVVKALFVRRPLK